MIQIKPITTGIPAKTATHLLVRPIINSTSDVSCNTYYEVIAYNEVWSDVEVLDDENNVSTVPQLIEQNTEILYKGNYPINEEQYAQWGSDNAFIENLVLEHLNLERL